ncbi:MAG TPA: metallophosphoesterase [Chloroflexota bacterium]|nr:metallophosphoesterase [Chloroflexota bacterium]
MRIGLFSDCEGNAVALQSILTALRPHAPDLLVCAGDVLNCPFSPDDPGETIALLRDHGVLAIPGNHDRYLMDWGTPRWQHTLWMRLRRLDPLGFALDDVAAEQARIRPEDLAWLRALPEERVLDGGRVYVCHGMPGNPWNSIWPRHPTYDGNVSDADREAALRVLARAAGAAGHPPEIVLCGHAPEPREYHDRLPAGGALRVIRGCHAKGQVGFAVLTRTGTIWDIRWEVGEALPRPRRS